MLRGDRSCAGKDYKKTERFSLIFNLKKSDQEYFIDFRDLIIVVGKV